MGIAEVTEAQLQELLNILSSLTADDVVVFAGSAPSSNPIPFTNNWSQQLVRQVRKWFATLKEQTLIDS